MIHPLDQKSSVILPPEILDKILEQIPESRERGRTLTACALAATWWTEPSRRHIFASVEIDESNYRQWVDGVVLSRSKDRLLEHVRWLWHSRGPGLGIRYQMRSLAQDAGGYLSGLRNLHDLALSGITVEHISEGEFHTCFSAFRETLTCLELKSFTTSFSAFVTLIGYFPNITTLRLRSLTLEPDGGPIPSLSRPLRGTFNVYEIRANFLEFLVRFSQLDMEYEELVIDSFSVLEARGFAETALRISPSTVKVLRLMTDLVCK